MKTSILVLCAVLFYGPMMLAQNTDAKQEVIRLSKEKWQWMADKNIDSLAKLFHDKAVFVHMGGAWGKESELDVIQNGGIWYKKATIQEVSVEIVNQTAILLNKITLLAVVGGQEVTNLFMVTEVYVTQNGAWTLGALSFTKLLAPPDNNSPIDLEELRGN